MKHNKNADTLLFLLSFTVSMWKKILKKHSLSVQALKKGEKQLVMKLLYNNIYQIQKMNFR